MAKKLTDLSQLTKAILKESPHPAQTPLRATASQSGDMPRPVEKPAPEPSRSREDADAAAVLAYFSRPSQNAPQRNRAAPCAAPAKDRTVAPEAALEAKDAALAALAEEKAEADERIAELERQLAEEREAHEAAVRERDRLQGECGRLQGELRKRGENTPVAAPEKTAPVAKVEPPKPTQLSPEASAEPRSGRYAGCILAVPATASEVFPGEVREHVVATLLDGLGSAERSGRERRAEILRYVLAANQSSGELERRRAELRQILKDAGYYNDPKPLERLGLRLISGRTHWKLQYANVRVTMSKTPSDYRANLNNGNEIANRCF